MTEKMIGMTKKAVDLSEAKTIIDEGNSEEVAMTETIEEEWGEVAEEAEEEVAVVGVEDYD